MLHLLLQNRAYRTRSEAWLPGQPQAASSQPSALDLFGPQQPRPQPPAQQKQQLPMKPNEGPAAGAPATIALAAGLSHLTCESCKRLHMSDVLVVQSICRWAACASLLLAQLLPTHTPPPPPSFLFSLLLLIRMRQFSALQQARS